MLKNEHKKVIIKIDPEPQQGNVKNTRRTLKTIQSSATDKENLAGRTHIFRDLKQNSESEHKKHRIQLMHKETQTEEQITKFSIKAEDLTSEEANLDYWKRLAEKRQESLDGSFQEIEKLKGDIEVLQEENKICKEMLEESRHLVEVLQEMINEGENEEETEENENVEKKESENDSN